MPPDRIEVTVPARLHLGFLDLHGGLGRLYGSLGLTLDAPRTRLSLRRAARDGGRSATATGPDSERALLYLRSLIDRLGLAGGFHLEVAEAMPAHSGLGSGTQLALAVGTALTRLCGCAFDPRALSQALGRGARSGIGIGAFEQGGMLLDGGRGPASRIPPIVSRLAIPEAWRFLLVFDPHRQGLHGGDESQAFERLPPFREETAAALCRLVVMAILPAVAEGDAARFGAAVTELQVAVGDHFADAQGDRFTSPAVAEALAWLESEGAAGVGQSSWGPTGFAVLPSDQEGRRLLALARDRWSGERSGGLTFALCKGRNRGAAIDEQVADDKVLTGTV